jgi:hypothetical protein
MSQVIRMPRYIRASNTSSESLHNELMLIDKDKASDFEFNPIANSIWDLLEKPLTLDELCVNIMEKFENETEQCIEEVEELISEMAKLGVVQVIL